MPVSAKSLHAAGRISDRQLAKLHGTSSQKSKMAGFSAKRKAEGAVGDKGIPEVCDYEIDKPSTQRTSSKFKPSKGASVGRTGSVTRGLINQSASQGPKFPAGGKASGSAKHKPSKLKGTTSNRSGVVYDEPDRNTAR